MEIVAVNSGLPLPELCTHVSICSVSFSVSQMATMASTSFGCDVLQSWHRALSMPMKRIRRNVHSQSHPGLHVSGQLSHRSAGLAFWSFLDVTSWRKSATPFRSGHSKPCVHSMPEVQ